MIILVVCGR